MSKINNKRKQTRSDGNGNSKLRKTATNKNNNNKNKNNGITKKTTKVRDEIVTSNGRIFYLCRYCNKVFHIKKERTNHLRKCPHKSYILTIADDYKNDDNNNDDLQEEQNNDDTIITNNNNNVDNKKLDAFDHLLATKTNEIYLNNDQIDIKQNIVLKKSKTPIKLTIRRSPSKDGNSELYFTVNGVEKTSTPPNPTATPTDDQKSEIDDKLMEVTALTTTTTPPISDSSSNKVDKNDNVDKVCRQCKLTFTNGIELLRHVRELHKYPKIIMAMSEIKKFYGLKNWTKCPICTKPLTRNYRSAFLRHLNTHANELEFCCNICGRKFRRSDHMKEHAKRHIIENDTNEN